jgi:hypothetical protein
MPTLPPLLALAYAASAVAIVRLRAWGVLLAVLASAVGAGAALAGMELTALAVHPMWPAGIVALLAVIPGVLLGLPVLLARVGAGRTVVSG